MEISEKDISEGCSSDELEVNEKKIQDKYYVSYILFYAMGIITILPGNFFPTANDYWMYKFRDPELNDITGKNKTDLQGQFTSVFSIISNVFMFVFVIITVTLLRRFTIVQRLIAAQIILVVFFIITIIFVEIDTDSWQMEFFIITTINGSILTAAGGVFMVTLFELASKFPPHYFASVLSGQSICGIASALVQIASLGVGASSTTNGLIYFLIGMLTIVAVFILFMYTLKNSEFFKDNMNKKLVDTDKMDFKKEDIYAILGKIKYLIIIVLLIQGCTIVVHPGLTALIDSVDKGNGNKWNDTFFVPVLTYLCASVAEFIGRELAGKLKQPRNQIILLSIGVLRLSFIPLFMYCNAHPRSNLPVVFDDWTYIAFINVFNLTNGYFVNLSILEVSSVTKEEETSIALILLTICMMVVLAICSFLNMAVLEII